MLDILFIPKDKDKDQHDAIFHDIPKFWKEEDIIKNLQELGLVYKAQS